MNPDQICKNCTHWFTSDTSQIQLVGRGICLRANSVQRYDALTFTDEGSQAYALTTVASTFGYEMAINQMETTAEFGCNQYKEAKE